MRAVTRLEGLTATQKSVLFVLADFEDDETGLSIATVGTIAHFAGCGNSTAFRVLRDLETKGFLTRKLCRGFDCRMVNAYALKFDKIGIS